MWEDVRAFLKNIHKFLDEPIFSIGDYHVSLWSIVFFIGTTALVIFLSRFTKRILVRRIFPRYHLDIGIAEAIGTIIQYCVVVVGFIVVLDSTGIDLSSLKIIAGALGVGIGFGLQNIVNNFVSGLIILFERPIKVGDRIEVGVVNGDVVKISARATTVVTNDNISIIVPNSDFTSKSVTNWSHANKVVRFNFGVGVSYKENPEKVKRVLLEIADANEGVLKNPTPDVLFDSFGDSYLNMILRVWTKQYIDRPGVLKSQLYYAIFKRFAEEGIEIPYPQQDLHLRSVPPQPFRFSSENYPGNTAD